MCIASGDACTWRRILKPLDFIATARDLAGANSKGRPRETNIRRAVSSTYYALFHCLATCNANMLVGGPGANRSQPAWRQAYRGLQHGTARQRCERQNIIIKFPDEIQDFAERFVDMQQKRHEADYDPDATFSKSDVIQDITDAEDVIHCFNSVPVRDRRAFAVYVLLPLRTD